MFFTCLGIGIFLLCLIAVDAAVSRRIDNEGIEKRREIVKTLNLTDLCLFTEARYTRHPSMADINSAFQEHPLALEHFPSGSLTVIPPHLRQIPRKPGE